MQSRNIYSIYGCCDFISVLIVCMRFLVVSEKHFVLTSV